MEETKIVLTIKKDRALYLFQHDDTTEFVVAYPIGNPRIGDYVNGWMCGVYFRTLEEAANYYKEC